MNNNITADWNQAHEFKQYGDYENNRFQLVSLASLSFQIQDAYSVLRLSIRVYLVKKVLDLELLPAVG